MFSYLREFLVSYDACNVAIIRWQNLWLTTLEMMYVAMLGCCKCMNAIKYSSWKLASSLIPCNVEIHTFAIYQALYHDMYKYALSVHLKTKAPKEKLKLCICVWTPMTWPRTSESTFLSKILPHSSWKTTQSFKMLWNNAPLRFQ